MIPQYLHGLAPRQRQRFYKVGVTSFLLFLFGVGVFVKLRDFAIPTPLAFTVWVPVAAGISAIHAYLRMGWRRLLAFIAICSLLCFGMEALSTHTGIPFGEYTYDPQRVGFLIAGVPWTVPLAWFAMLYPSVLMANLIVDGVPRVGGPGIWRIVLISFVGAGIMTTWDLALDPHMVHYEGAWTWRYSDRCAQNECMRGRSDMGCIRSCKQACTRPESLQYCVGRELFGPGETELGSCRKGERLAPFMESCARQCRAAAPDGDLEQGCEDLTRGVLGFEGVEESAALRRERKALNRGRNWKLTCERECCDADCEAGCVDAHPVISDDDDQWRARGGHPSVVADALRGALPLYFQHGYYRCIPFSNFYGWMITSFLAIFIYGLVKRKWIVTAERRAAAKHEDGSAAVFLILQIPDDLSLLQSNEGAAWYEKGKTYLREKMLTEQGGLQPYLNIQKILTGSGVLIYLLVAWCNVGMAHPAELSLLAMFAMGVPWLAAMLRLLRSDGEAVLAARMFAENEAMRARDLERKKKKKARMWADEEAQEAQSAVQQTDDEPDQGQDPAE